MFYASKASAYRLGAKLLSVVPKPLTSHGATNTQIDATNKYAVSKKLLDTAS